MAEADTLRMMTRTGGVRLVKRTSPEPTPASAATAPASKPKTEEDDLPPSSDPLPKASPTINLSGATYPTTNAPADPTPGAILFRRRTKIADVARIVLPPRREEAEKNAAPASPPATPFPIPESAPSAAVIPPSFPVTMSTENGMPVKEPEPVATPAPAVATPAPEEKGAPDLEAPPKKNPSSTDVLPSPSASTNPEIKPEPEKKPQESSSADVTAKPPTVPLPQVSSPSDHPAAEAPSASTSLQASDTRDKREFILSNGERIIGAILSETADSIYIDHGTLGVLTIPRSQIAQRPIEIILINGDRIVGDVIAETTDALFVRHASLGILTVPHTQRSTRVVEAILKDGDRILGEVLGETENFTVIRSATLGTVAVPHNRVAMLNRKVEQIQMKALPPAAPELEHKPSA